MARNSLLALVVWAAFDLTQINTSQFSGRASRLGYLGHVGGYVLTNQQLQSALRNDAFIIAVWDQEIETRRASHRPSCIRQRPCECDGVGEKQPASRFQESDPLCKDAKPFRKMVDCVDTSDGVEVEVREG